MREAIKEGLLITLAVGTLGATMYMAGDWDEWRVALANTPLHHYRH